MELTSSANYLPLLQHLVLMQGNCCLLSVSPTEPPPSSFSSYNSTGLTLSTLYLNIFLCYFEVNLSHSKSGSRWWYC